MMSRVHVIVSGRVQGVAFRYFAQRLAADLSLTGWVRNLHDGRVETVAEGEKGKLEEYVARIHEGPSLARVDDMECFWGDYRAEFEDFRIVFTAFG